MTFQAIQWKRRNVLFPAAVEVTDKSVIRHKPSWFSRDGMCTNISKAVSVHIRTGILWSEILIEFSGGTDLLRRHCQSKAYAPHLGID